MSKHKLSATPIKPSDGQKAKRKQPRKITAQYLHNSGLYYLQRFATSSSNFRSVMMRKVMRSCHVHVDQDLEACRTLVDELVVKFQNAGLLDDDVYLRGTLTSLRRRGLSRQSILFKLKNKGFSDTKITDALLHLDQENGIESTEAEMIAALTHARRKRVGPFGSGKEENFEKSLASFARKGFSYETARIVLEMKNDEAVERLEQR